MFGFAGSVLGVGGGLASLKDLQKRTGFLGPLSLGAFQFSLGGIAPGQGGSGGAFFAVGESFAEDDFLGLEEFAAG